MSGDENLTVLNHEALFHLKGKTLNIADSVMQEVLTGICGRNRGEGAFSRQPELPLSGVKENDADAWEVVLGWLFTLRRHRIAVVVVHHSGRNKENMRGTSRREDAAFWVLRLDEIEDGERREGARLFPDSPKTVIVNANKRPSDGVSRPLKAELSKLRRLGHPT